MLFAWACSSAAARSPRCGIASFGGRRRSGDSSRRRSSAPPAMYWLTMYGSPASSRCRARHDARVGRPAAPWLGPLPARARGGVVQALGLHQRDGHLAIRLVSVRQVHALRRPREEVLDHVAAAGDLARSVLSGGGAVGVRRGVGVGRSWLRGRRLVLRGNQLMPATRAEPQVGGFSLPHSAGLRLREAAAQLAAEVRVAGILMAAVAALHVVKFGRRREVARVRGVTLGRPGATYDGPGGGCAAPRRRPRPPAPGRRRVARAR